MAVVLRLARHGQKKRAYYRIVAAEKQCRRDGRFLEILGTFNPLVEPPVITLKEDRVRYWVDEGAGQSQLVRSLIKKQFPGLIEEKLEHKQAKLQAKRKKRKQQLSAKAAK